MEDKWPHPVDYNTLQAVNKAGLRKFYDLLLSRGDAGVAPAIHQLKLQVDAMFDELKSEVRQTADVVQSAITLIKGLKEQIAQNVYNPAELKAIVSDLDNVGNQLAAAVANTPATPTVDPPPEPTEPTPLPPEPAQEPAPAPADFIPMPPEVPSSDPQEPQ